MSTGFFELGQFVLCTAGPENIDHEPFIVSTLFSRSIFACVTGCVRGSQVPRCFSIDFLLIPNSFLFPVYGRHFHTVKCESYKFRLICKCTFLSFTPPMFFSRPLRGNFVPDVPTIVPHPLVLPSCVVAWVFFHRSCLRALPPLCTSPSQDALQGC